MLYQDAAFADSKTEQQNFWGTSVLSLIGAVSQAAESYLRALALK